MRADIDSKIAKMELTKQYKEQFEAQDLAELESRAEQNITQKEGSEPMSEEQKIG